MSQPSVDTGEDQDTQQDTPTPNDAAEATGKADEQSKDSGKEFTPPSSQEDLDRIIESRLARERAKYEGFDELKAKAAEFDKLEDAKKTDEQRSAERIAALESQLAESKLSGARARIAAENNLDPELLAGTTEDELAAHAEKLTEAIKSAAAEAAPTTTGARVPNAGRGTGSTPNSDDWIRNALTGRA